MVRIENRMNALIFNLFCEDARFGRTMIFMPHGLNFSSPSEDIG